MAPLRLEVFEEDTPVASGTVVTDLTAMEEARLATYEQGYSAGWEDASSAQKDERAHFAADLAHNMQSLGFTFHEARIHVLRALQPLLTEMVGQLLPQIAKEALAARVLEVLQPMAEELADTPVTLVFNPSSRNAIETLLGECSGLPLILTEEATLGEGQVYLRLGDCETRVDLDDAIAEITRALSDFLKMSSKEPQNG